MNYVKEIYTGNEDKLTSVSFARIDIDNVAFFIVHDFDNNCDICYNLRLSKFFLSSYIKNKYKIINLKSCREFPFKLRYYIFGLERDFTFLVNPAQAQVVRYLTLKKRICFNPKKFGEKVYQLSGSSELSSLTSFCRMMDLSGVATLCFNTAYSQSFSSLTVFCRILGLSDIDYSCFCATYSEPIYFFYNVTNLKKFKVAVTKYKILHPDDTVKVNF